MVKSVLVPLGLTAAATATHAAMQNKILGFIMRKLKPQGQGFEKLSMNSFW